MYKKATKGWLKHLDFTLIELACLFISLLLGSIIRHGDRGFIGFWNQYGELVYIMLGTHFILSITLHTFNNVLRRGPLRELMATIKSIIYTWAVTLIVLYATHITHRYSRVVVAISAGLMLFFTYGLKLLWKLAVKRWAAYTDSNTLLILASRDEAADIVKNIKSDSFNHNIIIGIATFEENGKDEQIEGVDVIASVSNVIEYVKTSWVDEVLVAIKPGMEMPEYIIEGLVDMGITVHVKMDIPTKGSVGMEQVVSKKGGMFLITNSRKLLSRKQMIIKRAIDILGGLVGCVIVGILYLWVAPKIKKESPGPVFFKQTRIGRNGRTFKIYKFRSMYMDAEERKKELMEKNNIKDGLMFKMDFDPRVIGNYIDEEGNEHTGIGDLIRRKSIDEFPQFINVLRGEMSLVGTRPPTPDEYEKYELHHKSRLAFPVGVTGMWQVSGRSEITDFEEVVRLDNEYINNWSTGLDLKILLKTVGVVLKGSGAK